MQSLGKPQKCKIFEEYTKLFLRPVIGITVDVVFNTYKQSIKSATRQKQRTKKRAVHKIIDHDNVPLLQVWDNFISLDDNKADLGHFLSKYCISYASELAVSGGFQDPMNAQSSHTGNVLKDL